MTPGPQQHQKRGPDPTTEEDPVVQPVKIFAAKGKVSTFVSKADDNVHVAKVLMQHYLHKRVRVRMGRMIVAGVCIVLILVPVVEKWVRPTLTGKCDNFSALMLSEEPECFVWPHSLWRMSCAFAMLIAVKLITLNPSRALLGSTDAAQRAGIGGFLERLLAMWNGAFAFLVCILTYKDASMGQALVAVPRGTSLVLTRRGWQLPEDMPCAEFSSSEELQQAMQLCFGNVQSVTVMVGATFMALGELMKLKCTDELPAKDWFDVSGLLLPNRALERSVWLRELRCKAAQLLRVLDKARAVSTEPEPSPHLTVGRVNSREELLEAHPRTRSRQLLDLREEATAYIRQMSNDCIRQPSERELTRFVLETDLDQVCWPFALQAFALVLWRPSDFVQVDHCFKFTDDLNWWPFDLLFGVSCHGDVIFVRNLHLAALGTAALVAILAVVWLILSGDLRLCKPRISPAFWILAAYALVFSLLRPGHPSDDSLASSALRWLGLQPLDWRQVLLLGYAVQVVVRLAIARGQFRDCCAPSTVELDIQDEQLSQARFEIFSAVALASSQGTILDQAALAGLGVLDLGRGQPLENPFRRARRRVGRFSRAADEGACAPPQSLRWRLLRRAQRGYSFLPTLSRLNESGDPPPPSDDLPSTSI